MASTEFYAKSTVPNIIMTDLNGQERNLYESLDAGKVVIVEVFSSWCTLCWELQKTQNLERIYNTYGPNGTDHVEVFYIEIEPNTSNADIMGADGIGDWTEDISYPVFNPSTISDEFRDAFAADGVPTSSVICPVTRSVIADIYDHELNEVIEEIQKCNTIHDVNDLQVVEPNNTNIGICKPTDIIFQAINMGVDTVTVLELEARFENGKVFNNFNSDVIIPPGEIFSTNFGEYILVDNLENELVNMNILCDDDVSNNNNSQIVYSHAQAVFNAINLRIRTDKWVMVDNTRWWVEDSSGNIVHPVTFLENKSIFEETIFLENNDCFTFIIEDAFGDGIVLGVLELSTEEGIVLYDDVDFGFRGEASFEFLGTVTSTSDLTHNTEIDLNLESTIISDLLPVIVSNSSQEYVNLSIVDIGGKVLNEQTLHASTGTTRKVFELNSLRAGIYFVNLTTKRGVISKRFVKL